MTNTFEINYFDNGSIATKREIYLDNKNRPVSDGEFVVYNEDGEITKREVYKDGELISSSEK